MIVRHSQAEGNGIETRVLSAVEGSAESAAADVKAEEVPVKEPAI
jgi:hypothetical protein